jgi:hypothetical protein
MLPKSDSIVASKTSAVFSPVVAVFADEGVKRARRPSPLSGRRRIPPPVITGISPTTKEGHSAESLASVAKGVLLRDEKYPTS